MIRNIAILFCLFCLYATTLASTSFAQTPDRKTLEKLEQSQKQARSAAKKLKAEREKMLREIDGYQTRLIRETARLRGLNREKQQLQEELRRLQTYRAKIKADIFADKEALSGTLAAMIRLEKNPPPALLVHPDNTIDAERAARLLGWLGETLQSRAKALKSELSALAHVENRIAGKRENIDKFIKAGNKKISQIQALIQQKNVLSNKLDKDRKAKIAEANRLARQAKDLSDLIAKFEARARELTPRLRPDGRHSVPIPRLKPKPGTAPAPVFVSPGARRFADARGQLPLPVTGRLIRKYGAPLAGEARAKGITLRTARGAAVIAPFDGRVEFAGPFNEDHVIILNVGGGYFIVLTGLGKTLVRAGTRIRAGEPIGQMSQQTSSPELFMEFRKHRSSINPMPWVGWAFSRAG